MLCDYIRDIGLVLSGGGAKGAHQIGFFKAFEEYDLWGSLTAVSGCSIGAVNALLAAKRDYRTQREAWGKLSLESLASLAPGAVVGNTWDYYPDRDHKYAGMTPAQYLEAAAPFPYNQNGLVQVMEEYASISKDAPVLHCCAYDMEGLRPCYFCLNDRSTAQVLTLIKASCNIPILLPPVEFEGKLYCDGGLMPPYCTGEKNSDKIPLSPFVGNEPGLIVVLYLSPYDALSFDCLPMNQPVLELYPSRPLERTIGGGTLDFSPKMKAENMQMGYRDGKALLAALDKLLTDGSTLKEATRTLNKASQYRRLALVEELNKGLY